jgi:hypothetical protein
MWELGKDNLHPIARTSKVMTMESRYATKTKAEENPLEKSG